MCPWLDWKLIDKTLIWHWTSRLGISNRWKRIALKTAWAFDLNETEIFDPNNKSHYLFVHSTWNQSSTETNEEKVWQINFASTKIETLRTQIERCFLGFTEKEINIDTELPKSAFEIDDNILPWEKNWKMRRPRITIWIINPITFLFKTLEINHLPKQTKRESKKDPVYPSVTYSSIIFIW